MNPEIEVTGGLDSGLFINAAMPINIDPTGTRKQSLILTPYQAAQLVEKLGAMVRERAVKS